MGPVCTKVEMVRSGQVTAEESPSGKSVNEERTNVWGSRCNRTDKSRPTRARTPDA